MVKGMLFKKLKMSQVYDLEGRLWPVSILHAPANFIIQVKTNKTDGYQAVQLGSGKKKSKKKPQVGHFKKAGIKDNLAYVTEVKIEDGSNLKSGQELKVEEVFTPGELVAVSGVSKGRGFAGAVKRWGFATQPKTHGQSDRERAPGAIGAQTPGRVFKGKKMPGHFGNQKCKVKNLVLVRVNPEKQEVWVQGAVPGYNSSWLILEKQGKKLNKFDQLFDFKDNE
ncbi:MAG: 50S ribosomal protein L3 [Candidatus Shapirobacteria bacterium]